MNSYYFDDYEITELSYFEYKNLVKNLKFKGVLLPFEKVLYDPLLEKLNNNGIVFENRTTKIQSYP